MDGKRSMKRAFIIFVYIIIFAMIIFGLYSLLKPAQTCFDGIKNQNETEIDCGGVCAACTVKISAQNVEVREAAFVYGGPGRYDVLAKISNPNHAYGAENFSYTFTLKDASGSVLASRSGTGFILPAEEKYILEVNLETSQIPEKVEFSASGYSWVEFSAYEEPNINVYSKEYRIISGGAGFGEAYGLVRNESHFDFKQINVNVILRDASGVAIAINKTNMQTVLSQEQRDFKLVWTSSFPGEVVTVETDVEANIFNNENFIEKYSSDSKRFQRN